jgi:hypothetical protein
MATLLKIVFILLTVILPGGLVVLGVVHLLRRRRPELDFSEQFRRVPIMRDRRTRQVVVPRRIRA